MGARTCVKGNYSEKVKEEKSIRISAKKDKKNAHRKKKKGRNNAMRKVKVKYAAMNRDGWVTTSFTQKRTHIIKTTTRKPF